MVVHLRRAKYQDVLVMPSRRPVQPGTALAASFSVPDADALDALADRIRRHTSDILDGPTDTPWNAREVAVRDPDDNTFVFTTRARNPSPGSVDDVMRAATREAP